MGCSRSLPTLRGMLLVVAVILIGSLVGCNSGGGDAPQQLAQARTVAEEGAFRNLGKRTSFDYGNVGAGAAPQD